jgi:hypothetical protein
VEELVSVFLFAVATVDFEMIVSGVLVHDSSAVRTLVDGAHAAEATQAGGASVGLEPSHHQVVGPVWVAVYLGAPCLLAPGTRHRRLVAPVVRPRYGFGLALDPSHVFVQLVLGFGDPVKCVHYMLKYLRGVGVVSELVWVHHQTKFELGFAQNRQRR